MAKKPNSTKPSATQDDVKLQSDLLAFVEETRDAMGEIAALNARMLKDRAKLVSYVNKEAEILQTNRNLEREIAEQEKLKASNSKNFNSNLLDDLKLQRKVIQVLKDNNRILKMTSDVVKSIGETIGGWTSNIENFVNDLPGGKVLSRLLGIDELNERLKESLNDAANAYTTTLMETKDPAQALSAAMKTGFGTISAMISPAVILAAAVLGLVKLFTDISKTTREISKDTGLTFGQSKQLYMESMKIQTSMGVRLSATEDIVEVQKEMISQFGTTNMLSAEQAATVSEIGMAFGYGAAQAGKVNAAFMQMGVSADDAANSQRMVAAEALKAGVNVGAVTKDIAENAKTTSKYFGGNVKALAAAAVEAAKMGVSLSTMSKVADKLLDIEGSLAAQFEFQALSGQQMNLDKARQLALEGDIAGATKEVMNNVGGISEFNKMSMLERKKLAEATGMEVDELQKSLAIQEKLAGATDEQRAAAMQLGLSASEISNLSAEELQNRLAQQDAQKNISTSFDSLKNTFMTALMPMAQALMDIFVALSPIIKGLGVVLKYAFTPLQWAGQALEKIIGFAKEYLGITMVIGGLVATEYALRQKAAIQSALENAYLTTKNMLQSISLSQLFSMDALKKAGIALGNLELVQLGRKIALNSVAIVKAGIEGALNLAKSIGSIFSSFALIPFGLGIPLAVAAAGGLFALFKQAKSVGDLAMSSNGGPIVASPREGAIFQGTRNDEVAMGPGVIGNANSSPSAPVQTSTSSDSGLAGILNRHSMLLEQIVMALKTPTPVQIGPKVIAELSSVLEVEQSYRKK